MYLSWIGLGYEVVRTRTGVRRELAARVDMNVLRCSVMWRGWIMNDC